MKTTVLCHARTLISGMASIGISSWKKAPFIRLLCFIIPGIMLQWYAQLPIVCAWMVVLICACSIGVIAMTPLRKRFYFSNVTGFSVALLFSALGALLVFYHDIDHRSSWIGKQYMDNDLLQITIEEPLAEKPKSYKAIASVKKIVRNQQVLQVSGKILCYFKKDSLSAALQYGKQLLIKRTLQPIRNGGNPGGFDYEQYMYFQGIMHQVYLDSNDYTILPTLQQHPLKAFIFRCQHTLLSVLRYSIHSSKELGLAEALLIGYKDDLDKTLVQSYSHTGVVHVIAISGLHLGLIYWLLSVLTSSLRKYPALRSLRSIIIIIGLWLFTLLAGAQPSILRSAVMFTCIVVAEGLHRKTSIFNTLALSAFILLCIHPFWLWDAGFQLSYSAVCSILLFMKPVYNWFYFNNRFIDHVWQLTAVTLSAQILTTPISIFLFHQFPNYFLLTNIIAIPLSTIILFGEIVLCALSFIPALTLLLGKILTWLIGYMNGYVEQIESLPYSVWEGLQLSWIQVGLLYVLILSLAYWLQQRSVKVLQFGLLALLAFFGIRSYALITATSQQRLIVYHIPRQSAVDLFHNRYFFSLLGDSLDIALKKTHLQPVRTMFRTGKYLHPAGLYLHPPYFSYHTTRVLILNQPVYYRACASKMNIDLLVLTGTARIRLPSLTSVFVIGQVITDGSVPSWYRQQVEAACDSLRIPFHDTAVKGAFVMTLR